MDINDFRIVDSTVVFCGSYQDSGIVGYFIVDDFFQVYATIHYCLFGEVNTLTKIAASEGWSTPDSIEAAMVGYTYSGASSAAPLSSSLFFIKISKVTNLLDKNHYTFNGGSPYGWDYKFQDVTETDNHFVAVGISNYIGRRFAVYRIQKQYNMSIDFALFNETTHSLASEMSLTALYDETIAATSQFHDSQTDEYATRIYFIDASNFLIKDIQHLKAADKAKTEEMTYLDKDSILLLLKTTTYPSPGIINSTVYYIDPSSTSNYPCTTLYDNNSKYCTIDTLSNHSFILSGLDNNGYHSFLHKVIDETITPKQCIKYDACGVSHISNLPSLQGNLNPLFDGSRETNTMVLRTSKYTIKPTCTE